MPGNSFRMSKNPDMGRNQKSEKSRLLALTRPEWPYLGDLRSRHLLYLATKTYYVFLGSRQKLGQHLIMSQAAHLSLTEGEYTQCAVKEHVYLWEWYHFLFYINSTEAKEILNWRHQKWYNPRPLWASSVLDHPCEPPSQQATSLQLQASRIHASKPPSLQTCRIGACNLPLGAAARCHRLPQVAKPSAPGIHQIHLNPPKSI